MNKPSENWPQEIRELWRAVQLFSGSSALFVFFEDKRYPPLTVSERNKMKTSLMYYKFHLIVHRLGPTPFGLEKLDVDTSKFTI